MNHAMTNANPISDEGLLNPALAVYLLISMTKRCNMRCPGCYLSQQQEGFFSNQDIPLDAAKTIVDFYLRSGIKMAVPNAEGEVLLHQGYSGLVAHINGCGFRNKPWLVTNGILLDKHADFVAQQISEVLISVDGATSESYTRFRGGNAALFNKVVRGIKSLVSARLKGMGHPQIFINTVISRDRLGDIPELIRFTENIGADTIKFSNFHPTGDRAEKRPLYFGEKEVMTMLEVIARRNDYKINIMFPQLFGASKPPYSCRMLASVVVGSNGDYSPCARIIPEAKWGNFFTSAEKHNSAPLKTFRLEVMRARNIAELPLICRECSHLAPQRLAFSKEHHQWFLSNVS